MTPTAVSAVMILIGLALKKLRRRVTAGRPVGTDVTQSLATIALKGGTVAGMPYNWVANGLTGRITLVVTLPMNTGLHIAMIGSLSREATPVDAALVPVSLEGDFPDYFRVFCAPGQEVDTLHLLDPADMAYLADFCRAYDLEIEHDTLTVSQAASAVQVEDKTSLLADAERLLTRNRRLFDQLSQPVA